MSDDREVLSVRILDKEYKISCLPEERESLLAAARELNERMNDMRDSTKVLGAERMAVMAALNVIHEREQAASRQDGMLDAARETVHRLETKLDAAIGRRENT
ncbi:MAG: cell division protein ZapA [Thiotrichales bacterium]|nr:cell division protein ZapA [Thiotrichales bacterium]